MRIGEGKLSKWFINCKDEELLMLEAMSKGAIGRVCYVLSLEQQLLKENIKKKGNLNKSSV
jgi:hypothetical protein